MSRDPLPGEVRPPGAEPPGEGDESADEREGAAEGFETLRAHGARRAEGDPPGAGPDSIPDDEAGPIGIFPSWAWVYGTVIAWASLLILLLYVFTITFDFGAR